MAFNPAFYGLGGMSGSGGNFGIGPPLFKGPGNKKPDKNELNKEKLPKVDSLLLYLSLVLLCCALNYMVIGNYPLW